ncbi:MAG: hypothetical protein A3I12_07715 [Gammaproteobacteria bacterium RIFCSPLOWO2_02_FULL_38_11]|nr:MAG: hypothetical protein A3B69_01425 [Gammaproteobacteria bacterium RIFCSPHIGHO2_02_FULL_38_33]OGT24101.1 MAG: hypothetical protein A2W47_01260 [Gammaproteobacteria bacterium RIFCSPHIGHO2_12_38_15]OGT67185.1 MAG: hypothetical protein A3I12_07715 [Gammaproteobacteria bacterium RIFCSPLOWO2_02_FULL_38_11]OGT77915.1 MAG: hypothetical protein A3G71_04740 [Gammaproteobacteria bacterium RIFCSPLOWO2_12_FULL_38_14]
MRSVVLRKSKKVLAFFEAIQDRVSFLKATKQSGAQLWIASKNTGKIFFLFETSGVFFSQ